MSDQEKWERIKGEKQSSLKRDLAEEIEGREVTDEEAELIICGELKDKDEDEYLVDGAVLSCTSAVWDDFPLSSGKVHLEGAEKKTKDDRPTGILRVWENPMYTNGLYHANVTDTKQGLNILPFPCNCIEPATTEQEQKIIENMDKCKKSGVCQYLMVLEEEWENIDFSESEHIAMNDISPYKEFPDVDATTSIGGVNVGSLGMGGLKNGQKQGITMTSVLFCKHGGFIYPLTSGQTDESTNFQFTLEQLKGCGWETATEEDLKILNDLMLKYGIISRDSAYMMLATMLAESGCTDKIEGGEKLRIALENAVNEEKKKDVWQVYKDDLKKKGIIVGNYNWCNRGAGYMQITGEDLQEQFLKYMDDPFKGEDKATYIGNNYPIESAVWYWTEVNMTSEGNLNAYVERYEASEKIFLIAQYFVNGYPTGHDATLGKIRDGEAYTIDEGKLYSNGDHFSAPNSWGERYPRWQRVEEYMNNEE